MRLAVAGAAPDSPPAEVRAVFRTAAAVKQLVVLDFAATTALSPAFCGLLLLLKKHQDAHGLQLQCEAVAPELRRQFFWNGIDYLL